MANLREKDDLLKGDEQGNERVREAAKHERERQHAAGEGSHDNLNQSPDERAAEKDDLEKSFSKPSYKGKEAGDNQASGRGRLAEAGIRMRAMARNHRKKLIFGGAGGGLIASLFLSFFALLPLKIEAMIKNIVGDRAERITDGMAQKSGIFMYQYASYRYGEGPTRFVITGGPLKSTMDTLALNGFERDLKDREGIWFEKGGGGSIRIHFVDGTVKTVRSKSELKRLFTARGSEADAVYARQLRAGVKNLTKWHLVKDRRYARLVAQRYGVRKWKHTSKKGTAEEFNKNYQAAATDEYKRRSRDFLARILGGSNGSEMGAGADGLVEEMSKTDTTNGITKEIMQPILGKFIPLIGWVDLGVRLDVAGREDAIGDFIREKNIVQYVHVFAFWGSVADGLKAGEISGEQVNAAMLKLDGMEKGAAFQAVFMKRDGGEKIPDENRVDWDGTTTASNIYKSISTVSGLAVFSYAWHNTISRAIDAVGGAVSTVTVAAIRAIPGVGQAFDALMNIAADFVTAAINFILKPVITGLEIGAPVINAVFAGADVVYNEVIKDHGGQEISAARSHQRRLEIAAETRTARLEQPFLARITDTESVDAPLVRLALATPNSPSQAVDRSFQFVAGIMSNPADIFKRLADLTAPRAVADTHLPNMTGQKQYDWDPAVLAADFDEHNVREEATECGDAPRPDECKANTFFLNIVKPMYTTEDDGGLGDMSTVGSTPSGAPGAGAPGAGQIVYPPNLGTPNNLGYYQMPANPEYILEHGCPARGWGSKELIGVVYTVALQTYAKYPDMKLEIGDLNAGAPHTSHAWGVGVDLTAQGYKALNMNAPGYVPEGRARSIEIGKMLLDTKMIKNIWYNDPSVNNALLTYARERNLPITQIKPVRGHDNHFHVDITGARGPESRPNCR